MPPGFGEARVCQVFLASDISTLEAPSRTSESDAGRTHPALVVNRRAPPHQHREAFRGRRGLGLLIEVDGGLRAGEPAPH